MPLKSMTGFGRSGGQDGEAAWSWEVRTVNNRGLDVRLRLPPGLEEFELRLRDALAKCIARGSCAVSLSLKAPAQSPELRLNEDMLMKINRLADRAGEVTGRSEQLPLSVLLGIKGVIEIAEQQPGEQANSSFVDALLKSFQAALDGVLLARHAEGARLRDILAEKLTEIETLTKAAEAAPARRPEAIAERLRLQLQRLLNETSQLDEQRLYQEAALIATKADIEEELKRLYAHVGAARELLDEDVPVGRKLEFLAQEFQREANTLCSKSNAAEITQIGLRLKAAIDQLREQVQNVE
jgi:uncharacterized protein (TIGR00255 family)